jgi:ornithine--oxo-acid transaminase
MTALQRARQAPTASPVSDLAADLIGREKQFGARNYDPLPVVLTRGEGSWLIDVDGRRYLDLMSAYSAVSFGHAHPRIIATLIAQAQSLGVTSRA